MNEDEGALAVRTELDALAAAAPAVGFTADEVVRRGRRRRQARRGTVAAASAVALAAVVAVPAVALRDTGGGPGGTQAASPGHTTPSASATTPVTKQPVKTIPGRLTVPGVSSAQADSLATRCALSSTGGDAASALKGVRTYNVVRDAYGTHALVYGPADYLSCDVEGSKVVAGAVTSGTSTRWLPGRIAVDGWSAKPGGPAHSGPDVPSSPGYDLVEGRVGPDVRSVDVRIGENHARVPAVNGTYVARFVHSLTWEPQGERRLTIEAYDAGNRTVASVAFPPGPQGCYYAPDGTVLGAEHRTPACKPVLIWR